MDSRTLNLFRSAEEAVAKLVAVCGKGSTLYARNPKVVAQVSRTGKWLLHAITALHKELKTPIADDKPAD